MDKTTIAGWPIEIAVAVSALVALGSGSGAFAQVAEANPMHISPHEATLSVADPSKEAKWYEDVLGFHETRHVQRLPEFELRSVDIPGYRFDLVYQRGSIRVPPAPRFTYQGYSHVVLQTPILDAVYQRMVARGERMLSGGVQVEPERNPNPPRELTIWDPEGNELEIFPPSNPSAGPIAQDTANPLQFAPHHVAITVAEISTEAVWYARVFGFQKTAYSKHPSGLEGQFMDIPGYRLMLEMKPGSIRPPAQPRFFQQGYVHIVYQTTTLDEDYKRLMALGIKIDAERDPKSNALLGMLIKDPEGNEIEIAAPQ